MSPRSSTPAVAVLALALSGCSLLKAKPPGDGRKDPDVKAASAEGPAPLDDARAVGDPSAGRVLAPRRCELTVAIPSRPVDDPVLAEAIWRLADDQAVPAETRKALEANGLRMGVIVGGLPTEVEALFRTSAPDHVEPSHISLPDGDHTLIQIGSAVPQASLLLSRRDSASGKEYADAVGAFRLTASQSGPGGVALRFVPEIHHGPVRHDFAAAPNANPLAPQQFVVKNGQQEEALSDLAATLTLQPGQIVVLGARGDRDRSLGSFLFTQTELNSDRVLRKVLLIWAVPSNSDAFGRSAAPDLARPGFGDAPAPAGPRELPMLKALAPAAESLGPPGR